MKEINTIDLTVIIPIHSVVDPNFKMYLDGALTSIKNNKVKPAKVLLVRCACTDVTEELKTFDFTNYDLDIEIIENVTGKSLGSQLNYGVENTKTKYFTFLEFDDEFSINWLKNVLIYTDLYKDVAMFLPIINETKDEQFISYSNEAAWAMGFCERLGFLDLEVLLEYPDFNLSGMVVNTEIFKSVGGMKPSIKLSFNYELLLRVLYNTHQVMVIPKIGYMHRNLRPGSLFWSYKNDETKMEPEEVKFWMDIVARKEYFFTEDRKISYAKQTT